MDISNEATCSIKNIGWEESKINVSGLLLTSQFKVNTKKIKKAEAFLYDSSNNIKIPLSITIDCSEIIRFSVQLDFSGLELSNIGDGYYDFWIGLSTEDDSFEIKILDSFANRKLSTKSNTINNRHAILGINDVGELYLEISQLYTLVTEVEIKNNYLIISGWTTELFKHADLVFNDKNHSTLFRAPVKKLENESGIPNVIAFQSSVKLDDIHNKGNPSTYYVALNIQDKSFPLVSQTNEYFTRDSFQIHAYGNLQGFFQIHFDAISPSIDQLTWNQDRLDIVIKICNDSLSCYQLQNIVLHQMETGLEYSFELTSSESNEQHTYYFSSIPFLEENGIPLMVGEWKFDVSGFNNLENTEIRRTVYDTEGIMFTSKSISNLLYVPNRNDQREAYLDVLLTQGANKPPKVSVIVPIYNVEEFLDECLQSLVNQKLKDIEVIMVNDGSPDSSADIMERYSNRYPNFISIHKENGGLGHARNYGVSYARGEFIAFLDSDDYVTRDAYEKMYQTVKESGSDMVVGNAVRFNSSRVYSSSLHRMSIKETSIRTHISERPELIYDAAAWNKLYKTTFWHHNKFRFPEGILYEDIPVTIPAHFKSTSTDVLEDVIYYWRVREGENKSITQQRNQIKNFLDRLKVLKMLDEFYIGNQINDFLTTIKDIKALNHDLILYINQLNEVDDEYRNTLMAELPKYLNTISESSYDRIDSINRLKYYLIRNGKLDELLKVINYEKHDIKYMEVENKNGTILAKYPFYEELPSTLYEITDELDVVRKIENIQWDQTQLTISGYAYINKINMDKKRSTSARLFLVNTDTNKQVELSFSRTRRNDVTYYHGVKLGYSNPLKRLYNYDWSGFNIEIDFSDKEVIALGEGRLHIQMQLSVGKISREFRIGGPIAGKKPRPDPKIALCQSVSILYNASWDLALVSQYVKIAVNKVEIDKNELVLYGWSSFPINHTIVYLLDSKKENRFTFNPSKFKGTIPSKLFSIYDRVTGFVVKIPLHQLEQLKYKPTNWNVYVEHNMEQIPLPFISNNLQNKSIDRQAFKLRLTEGKEGNLQLRYSAPLPQGENISWSKENLNIHVKFNRTIFRNLNKKYNEKIIIIHRESKTVLEYPAHIKVEEDHYVTYSSLIPIYKDDNNPVFRTGAWDLFFHAKVQGGMGQEKEIKFRIQVHHSEVEDLHSVHSGLLIKPYRTEKGKLSLNVSQHWPWFERTPRRRDAIQTVLYPLFRLLPLNKKSIVFSSYWGKSFNCNPRAIYEYMLENHPEFQFIWFFNDENTSISGNAKRIRIKSWQYYYYLSRAKYFINNVNFDDVYVKRNGQIEVQTLHGTFLKTMGLDVPGETDTPDKKRRFLRRCGRWDFLISPSRYMTEKSISCFKYNKQILEIGFPRNDILVQSHTLNDLNDLKTKLGIPLNKKIILYAPTWREHKTFDFQLDLNKLQASLGDEYVILLRLHYYVSQAIDVKPFVGFAYDLSDYHDIQELYLISDILITDYSSVMFDYANLNRPMLFFTYDLEHYRDQLRGLYIDFENEAPGPLLRTTDEIINVIQNLDTHALAYQDKFNSFRDTYCQFDKGNASELLYNKVFGPKKRNKNRNFLLTAINKLVSMFK